MRLIKPSFKIISDFNPMIVIEKAGRLCYKSEENVTEESAIEFVQKIKERKHTSVLEHGSFYAKLTILSLLDPKAWIFYVKSLFNKYSYVRWNRIYSNYRVILETHKDKIPTSLEPFVPKQNDPLKRVCVHFICDRGVSHELVRHRVASFSQESTRFCNYAKNRFDNQLTFIIPNWIEDIEEGEYVAHAMYHHAQEDVDKQWYDVCMNAEFVYMDLIRGGWKPQQARAILPNSLKTEIAITMNLKQWKHFFKLRCAKDAHPQMRELAIPLFEYLVENNYLSITAKDCV